MSKIHLPCLRGQIGEWAFFSTIMRVKDIVENKRIITVPESKELYNKNINEVLQREITTDRIEKIKEYILKNKERFFGSLIVAIYKGGPIWSDVDIEEKFRIENKIVDGDSINFIENKIGILTLSGLEEIFVLDGQHRLLGIRKAYKDNEIIGEDELSIILIIHNQNLKEKTRRLFTVLNRYAEKIKPAEKVILEEDDAAAILTRKLVSEHTIFTKDNALSNSKAFSLPPSDLIHFTTLVCLYEIHKVIIDFKKLYPTKVILRPDDNKLNIHWELINEYWEFFFQTFPKAKVFIEGKSVPKSFKRNKKTGGSLLLRPEGQLLIAEIYSHYKNKNELNKIKRKFKKIDFNLNGKIWKYVFWSGTRMISKNKKLKKSLFFYLLGEKRYEEFVQKNIKKVYDEFGKKYKEHIKSI